MSSISVVATTATVVGALVLLPAPATRLQARVSVTIETLVPHSVENADHDTISPVSKPAPTPFPEPVPSHRSSTIPRVETPQAGRVALHPSGPVTRPAASSRRHDWLTSSDGTLNTRVGVYTDCSGASALTYAAAAIDTCVAGPTYFVGHNAGVFTPLMHLGVGSIITYYDGDAVAHAWRVVSVRPRWRAADGAPPPTEPDVVAQFQTCAAPDGSTDRILDVVAA
jgi:hypothetical protein